MPFAGSGAPARDGGVSTDRELRISDSFNAVPGRRILEGLLHWSRDPKGAESRVKPAGIGAEFGVPRRVEDKSWFLIAVFDPGF